mgnify:CR=1 FL=1
MVKKVLKFGGTSVGTVERIQHVAMIIKKEHEKGNKIIAVVSAMSGKTNELIGLSKEIAEGFLQMNELTKSSTEARKSLNTEEMQVREDYIRSMRGYNAKLDEFIVLFL